MNLFIDCEWNAYKGELISMALVPESTREKAHFYTEFKIEGPMHAWVEAHVKPNLGDFPKDYEENQVQLEQYLARFQRVHLIADWPEDIERFCELLITGPGTRLNTPPLTMEILRVDTESSQPHHAYYDALALRDWYVENK